MKKIIIIFLAVTLIISPIFSDIKSIVKNSKNAVIEIRVEGNKKEIFGTGFFITKSSILTCFHLIDQKIENAYIIMNNDSIYSVKKIMGYSKMYDMAILDIGLDVCDKPLEIADKSPEVGEEIIIVGNPLGYGWSVSDGLLSGKRNFEGLGETYQTTASISMGSSGSPMMNLDGEVIGIISFKSILGENINFGIPISRLKEIDTSNPEIIYQVEFNNNKISKISKKEKISEKDYIQETISDEEIEKAVNSGTKLANARESVMEWILYGFINSCVIGGIIGAANNLLLAYTCSFGVPLPIYSLIACLFTTVYATTNLSSPPKSHYINKNRLYKDVLSEKYEDKARNNILIGSVVGGLLGFVVSVIFYFWVLTSLNI